MPGIKNTSDNLLSRIFKGKLKKVINLINYLISILKFLTCVWSTNFFLEKDQNKTFFFFSSTDTKVRALNLINYNDMTAEKKCN